MFEAIGIIAVWLLGGALAFYVPLLIGINMGGEGLAGVALGVVGAKVALAAYLLATVVYFIVT